MFPPPKDPPLQNIANNTAKLFAFDYTNIRGKNDNEVASSKNITWRVDAP